MQTVATVLVVALAVVLLATAVVLFRSRSARPWPAIAVAMLTSAVCYTVGGTSAQDTSGPSIATVIANIVGLVSVIAAILALVPRSGEAPASRSAIQLAAAAIVLGAVGLLVNLVTG
jgi:hypothetical protein